MEFIWSTILFIWPSLNHQDVVNVQVYMGGILNNTVRNYRVQDKNYTNTNNSSKRDNCDKMNRKPNYGRLRFPNHKRRKNSDILWIRNSKDTLDLSIFRMVTIWFQWYRMWDFFWQFVDRDDQTLYPPCTCYNHVNKNAVRQLSTLLLLW